MSVQPIALQLGDSSSVLIERYCQGHCELLLLCENEWVGFGDGYLCSECGDGSHLVNLRGTFSPTDSVSVTQNTNIFEYFMYYNKYTNIIYSDKH